MLLTQVVVRENEIEDYLPGYANQAIHFATDDMGSVSMVKILGYENREIAGLYLLSTTIVLILVNGASVFLGVLIMSRAWEAVMSSYSGWFSFVVRPVGYVKMFAFVLVGYLIVMFFDFGRIKRISMEEALKNVE